MLLLAVDTSARDGSVALAEYTPASHACEVIESVPLAGGAFSAQLVPQIAELLGRQGLRAGQVDGLVAVSGPGSFTGLRIGLAAIKALAEVLRKPIAVVSRLETLAAASLIGGRVFAAVDAGRSECYLGEYEVRGSGVERIAESLVDRAQLLVAASGAPLITPDPALVDWIAAQARETPTIEEGPGERQVQWISTSDIGVVAALGGAKVHQGRVVSPEALEANYIRRSDPEVQQEKRSSPRR